MSAAADREQQAAAMRDDFLAARQAEHAAREAALRPALDALGDAGWFVRSHDLSYNTDVADWPYDHPAAIDVSTFGLTVSLSQGQFIALAEAAARGGLGLPAFDQKGSPVAEGQARARAVALSMGATDEETEAFVEFQTRSGLLAAPSSLVESHYRSWKGRGG